MKQHQITMLGTGLIGMFYTKTLHRSRSHDRVSMVYSRTEERAKAFAEEWGIPRYTTDMKAAINDPETDIVVIGLPNNLHLEAIRLTAEAGKAILCTKPLGRNATEAKEMLDIVEKAGVFHGYLEDLVYTPKTLKTIESIKNGALGRIIWTRSREAHPGPHSDWFWDMEMAGGGAILDIGCHCIELGRCYVGKDIKPVEVMCWADTMVKPIAAEDNALGWVKYENGVIAQFEVSWAYRGGLDIRDEIVGVEGTVRLDHFFHTGFEMFTTQGQGYVAEKAESETGWLFPVGDEVSQLGYINMFDDMLEGMDKDEDPMESFYDGYVVNAIMDACYKSAKTRQWESVELEVWRGKTGLSKDMHLDEFDEQHYLIKEELLPDGRRKFILKEKESGKFVQKVH